MSLKDLLPKNDFSKKTLARFEEPRNCGRLFEKPEMPLVMVQRKGDGFEFTLYALIDSTDGVVADCKFKAFAPPLLLAALDVSCDLLIRKHYSQIRRIKSETIFKQLDEPDIDLRVVFELFEEISISCENLNLPLSPVPHQEKSEGGGIEGWALMPHKEKLATIESVINEEVRPYIELDEGGITIEELVEDELVISYSGACTSCHSSVGSTLSAIQEILRAKIHQNLRVTPKL
jgi:NifU-like protein